MSDVLLIKKLHFKARRGMKETSAILTTFLNSLDSFSETELNELSVLLECDDQMLFDMFFKSKAEFKNKFPSLKKYLK